MGIVPVHRKNQIQYIENYINLSVRGQSHHLFLHGQSGSGKSFCIKHAVSKSEIKSIFINCWEYNTRSAILSKMCIDLGIPVSRKGVPSDSFFERLENKIKNIRATAIILDNIDKLNKKSEALYDMLKLCEHNKRIMIIAISQSKNVLEKLDKRVLSRFNPLKIEFPAYTKEQLLDILKEKVELKDHKPLVAIADYISSRNGDCRIALECLRRVSITDNFNNNDVFKVLNGMN